MVSETTTLADQSRTKTVFIYDGNQIVMQFDSSGAGGSPADLTAANLSHRYLWGPAVDQLLADEQLSPLPPVNGQSSGYDQTTPGTVAWALTDNENTVRDLAVYTPGPGGSQGTTAIVNHRVYDSYGNLVSSTNPSAPGTAAAVDCVFGYTGEMFDQITGLQYNWQRWYDPSTGRWMSQDPSGIVGSEDANLYRYCGNGPESRGDPFGEWVWPWDPSASWNPFKTFTLWTGLRPPDFFSVNVNVAIPTPLTGTLLGWSGQAAIDSYGDVFVSPLGFNFGKSATFVSGSLTGGWLDAAGVPGQGQLQGLLSGNSFNFGGGYGGGAQRAWTPGCGWATQSGIYSPQAGAAWDYSWFLGNSGLTW
jgi:RHS repeat-associated protein